MYIWITAKIFQAYHFIINQNMLLIFQTLTFNVENVVFNQKKISGEVLLDLQGHGGPAYKCRFFPSGQVVISAGADGSCKIWSAENGLNPVTLIGHKMAVTDLTIVEKGRNVVTVSK